MLRDRATQAFQTALAAVEGLPTMSALRRALEDGRDHIDGPMRVAIVGKIKAGKSTMMNALLGERLAATGTEELTFNVNWFRHGHERELIVHFKDGRPPEARGLEELRALTGRQESNRELLRSIRHIEVRHPARLLRRFDLVDTPGLRSAFGDDERNTLEFLGLGADDLDDLTVQASRGADAVLCLFSRGMGESDQALVRSFRGPALAHATPINAIGVLTKVDDYWPEHEDPFAAGARIAARLASDPAVERVFYAVLAVSGQLGFAAGTLTADELATVDELAALPAELVAKRLRYADRFAAREFEDLPVPVPERAAVLARLGRYGVHLASSLRRAGLAGDELRAELLERSGVRALRDLVLAHFGNRALLIKAEAAIQRGLAEAGGVRRAHDDQTRRAAGAAAAALERLFRREPAFAELDLLRCYYQDPDAYALRDGEREELLRITGEAGPTAAARLGLDERAMPSEMAAVAERRLAHWREHSLSLAADARANDAARGMASAYERIVFHVREASRHLELDA